MVIDNRPGAGSTVGTALVARAPADGYTVLVSSPTIAISPALYKKLSYDAIKDFAPVARLAAIENVMVVHPSVPAKTLKQFIDLAKSKPGKLNYASAGSGSGQHMYMELARSAAGIQIQHIPYKGGGEVAVQLVGNHVDSTVNNPAEAVAQWRAGPLQPGDFLHIGMALAMLLLGRWALVRSQRPIPALQQAQGEAAPS
mgnify:CR=1 FL=1